MKKIKATIAAILTVCAMLNLTGCSENREQGSNLNNSSADQSGSDDKSNSGAGNSDSNSSDTSNSDVSNSDTGNSGNSEETIKTQYAPITLTDNNTVNSIRLFDAITADKDNAMFSPLSLNMALGLIEAGAEGDTKAAIDSYLQTENYADFAQSYLKYARDNFIKEERRGDWYFYPRSTIEIANSVWADNALPLKDEYKQRVGSKFDAEIQNTDFGKKTETLNKINGWVNEKTHEMIPTALRDYDENTTAVVLINTVYFESPWDNIKWWIDESNKENFTLLDGTVKEMPLMHSYGNSYFENDRATAFSRDYSNGTKFIGILPKESGEFTLEELDIPSLLENEYYSSGKVIYDISAVMPRLKFDSDFDLRNALCAAGMENIFDEEAANFSGISDMPLWITKILQKTSLELDENGTKAAAVTVEIGAGGGGIEEDWEYISKTVRLDRPFAFMIYDDTKEQILFVGKVTNP